jgi:myo-inositol-1(or 4)-monophosphatase
MELALATARAAVVTIRTAADRGVSVAATKSSDVDVVTETDRSVEALIRSTLLAARPDDAVLGEEGDDLAGSSGVRWIVDPIDGTVNFLYGLPQYAESIAAERDGTVVAGVVVNAATGVEWTAYADSDGSLVGRRDGRPVAVRAPVPLGQMLVGTGFSYEAHHREQQARALVALLPRIRDIRRLGACSLDLCAVADGSLDAYLEEGINLWDHAAGGLVARAAGATVQTAQGAGGRLLVMAAPAGSFPNFREAAAQSGYLAPE